jgi:hypothetical protein
LCLAQLGFKAPVPLFAQQYCNQRFHYCLDYPASMFPFTFISPDEDSLVFSTADKLSELTVIATPAADKLDSHQAFEERLKSLTKGQPYTILSIINGDDYYEVNYLFGGYWYHQKAGFFPTYDVLYTAKVPVNRTEMMVLMKADVRIEF